MRKSYQAAALVLVALAFPYFDSETEWPVLTRRAAVERNLPRYLKKVGVYATPEVGGMSQQELAKAQAAFPQGFEEYAKQIQKVLTLTKDGKTWFATAEQARWSTLNWLSHVHILADADGFTVVGEVPNRLSFKKSLPNTSQIELSYGFEAVTGKLPVQHRHLVDGVYDVIFFERLSYEPKQLIEKLDLFKYEAKKILARGWKIGLSTWVVWWCCWILFLATTWTRPTGNPVERASVAPRQPVLVPAPRRASRRAVVHPYLKELTELRSQCQELAEPIASTYSEVIAAMLAAGSCTREEVEAMAETIRIARTCRQRAVIHQVEELLAKKPRWFTQVELTGYARTIAEMRGTSRCRLTMALHILDEVQRHIPREA